VHCPVRVTSAQPLGFRAVDRWGALSFCCTGQSGATLDSLVTSDFAALTSVWHCSSLYTLRSRPLARTEPLPRWLTGQSGGTPDSPVNYSGGCPIIPGSGWFGGCLADAPDSVWCTILQNTLSLAPFLIVSLTWFLY
jgi:hypothetical protein